jgi:hypothetical protein
MIRKILFALLLLIPSLSFAGSIRVGAIYLPDTASRTMLDTAAATTSFDSAIAPEIALGASLFGNVEGEISLSRIRSDVDFDFREFDNALGPTDITPLSASLYYTAPVSSAAVYVGGGVTHVMVGDFSEEESQVPGLDASDDTTWHAAGGVRIPFNRFAIDLGAMYLPFETTLSAPQRDPLVLELDPLLIRAGIRYSF